jgi:hypothetical protein
MCSSEQVMYERVIPPCTKVHVAGADPNRLLVSIVLRGSFGFDAYWLGACSGQSSCLQRQRRSLADHPAGHTAAHVKWGCL